LKKNAALADVNDSALPDGLNISDLLDWELVRKYSLGSDKELEDHKEISYDCYEYSGLHEYWGIYRNFISRAGIFLIVLSCRAMADDARRKSTLVYLQQVFGLVSRVACGTPIVIVATNQECAGIQLLIEINRLLVSTLEIYPAWRFVKKNDEQKLTYFTIDNNGDKRCGESAAIIRTCIAELTLKDGADRIMPVEWYQVYHWILKERESGDKAVIKLADIQAKFPHVKKLKELLSQLSELGVVLYFTRWSYCNMFCVLQPNKFLHILCSFLRPPPLSALQCDFPPPMKLWKSLRDEGLFSLDLLQCFESAFGGEYDFMKHLLQRLGLVTPWNSQAHFTLKLSEFLFPSRIPNNPFKFVIDRKAELVNNCHLLRLVINPSIPWGFRPRLLGRLVKKSVLTKEGPRMLLLSKRVSFISIGYDEFIIDTLDSTETDEASRSFNIAAPYSSSAKRILQEIMNASDFTLNEYPGTTYSIKLGMAGIDYLDALEAIENDSLENTHTKWFETSSSEYQAIS